MPVSARPRAARSATWSRAARSARSPAPRQAAYLSTDTLSTCRYVFLPLQVSGDTQIKLHSDVGNLEAIRHAFELAANESADLFVKLHPAETDAAEIVVYDNFVRGTTENLADALKDPRVKIYDVGGDILQTDILSSALKGVDGVFHFAALWLLQCHEFPRAAFDVNIRGTFNVLEAAVEAGGPLRQERPGQRGQRGNAGADPVAPRQIAHHQGEDRQRDADEDQKKDDEDHRRFHC